MAEFVPTAEILSPLDMRPAAILSGDFLFLIVTSCLLATFGLLEDSTAVVIGAMIVAPLMRPIRAMAWGALQADPTIFRQAITTLVVGVSLALVISCLLGAAIGLQSLGHEVLSRTAPNLLDLGVAIVAGVVSAYAKLRPRIGDAIAGTAIAVALMPPLCAAGLCAAHGSRALALGAFLLFVTNLIGIAFSCMAVFAYFGEAASRTQSRNALVATALLAAGLSFPLGHSLIALLAQARLTTVIEHLLTSRTVTVGQRMALLSTQVNWDRAVPEVHLLVRTHEVPTRHQVALLELFVEAETHRRFKLVFDVTTVSEVRSALP